MSQGLWHLSRLEDVLALVVQAVQFQVIMRRHDEPAAHKATQLRDSAGFGALLGRLSIARCDTVTGQQCVFTSHESTGEHVSVSFVRVDMSPTSPVVSALRPGEDIQYLQRTQFQPEVCRIVSRHAHHVQLLFFKAHLVHLQSVVAAIAPMKKRRPQTEMRQPVPIRPRRINRPAANFLR